MFKDKRILIIGGTGTVGQALINQILKEKPEVIRVYSRDEYKQFLLSESIGDIENIRYLIGDVRDKERLNRAMHKIDIVFNLAALKHVPSCEYNPFEAVKTNIIGTQNVIECAMENKVKKVVYTSSDKSVSPTNTMGATKLLAERLMTSANNAKGDSGTIFTSVRFGNVLGSRGSVIPLFIKQILEQRRITITDGEMTRFMMSVSQAATLTIKALSMSKGGEIFVLKMPVLKLKDLSEVIMEEVCIKHGINRAEVRVETIGLRPGEKMYEELMTMEEASTAYDMGEMYIITSVFNVGKNYELHKGCEKADIKSYTSEGSKLLSKEEIRKILLTDMLI